MKSKISFCHSAIIKNNFSRYFPFIIAYTLAWIMIFPISLYQELSYYQGTNTPDLDIISGFKYTVLSNVNSLFIIVAAIVIAMITFSYIFQGKNCNMYHSLPIKREQLFLSNFISGLSFLLIPLIITFFITVGIGSLFNCLDLNASFHWLGATILISFFFYSFGVFCAMFTGNILALPAFYFILNFLVVALEMMIIALFSSLIYGLNTSQAITSSAFSPAYYVLSHIDAVYDEGGNIQTSWSMLWIYGIAAIIMIVISLYLYKKRHLETAGDSISIKWVKPIFLYGVAFCFSLCFTLFILSAFNLSYRYNLLMSIIIWMFIGGFFGYFIARMILYKSFRVIKSGLKGWFFYSIVVLLITIFINSDVFGFETNLPDIEEIESVSYSIYHNTNHIDSKTGNIQEILDIHKSALSNRKTIERELSDNGSSYTENGCTNDINITYHLKNGKTMSRYYHYWTNLKTVNPEDSFAGKIDNYINSPENIIESSFPDITSSKQLNDISLNYLSASGEIKTHSIHENDTVSIYQAMIKDVKEGNLKIITPYSTIDSEISSCTISFSFNYNSGILNDFNTGFQEFSLPFSAVHTLKALEDTGNISSIDDLEPYTDFN